MYEFKHDDFVINNREISGDLDSVARNRTMSPPTTSSEFLEATDAILNLPGVTAVRWRQYTPYFNDGDPCEFTVDGIYVRLTPLEEEDDEECGDYGDGFISEWEIRYNRSEYPDFSDELVEELTQAVKKWDSLNSEEVCRRNFGDHSTVTATLKGFDVEEYDHD